VGNNQQADEQFKKTVEKLDQKFCLVPQNLKEAYLIHVLKTLEMKRN
jgi:hypothetical protein